MADPAIPVPGVSFFTLPPEIRNTIYALVLLSEDPINLVDISAAPALVQTSRVLSREALPIYLAGNTFTIDFDRKSTRYFLPSVRRWLDASLSNASYEPVGSHEDGQQVTGIRRLDVDMSIRRNEILIQSTFHITVRDLVDVEADRRQDLVSVEYSTTRSLGVHLIEETARDMAQSLSDSIARSLRPLDSIDGQTDRRRQRSIGIGTVQVEVLEDLWTRYSGPAQPWDIYRHI